MQRYSWIFSILILWSLASSFDISSNNLARAGTGCVEIVGLKITEIMPVSTDGNEWIELFNENNEEIDISQCFFADSVKGSHYYDIPDKTVVKPQGYLVLYGKFYLNNDGSDAARLISENKEDSIFEISYKDASAQKNKSFAFQSTKDEWSWTSKPTPGAENKFDPPEPSNDAIDSGSNVSSEKNTCAGIIISELMPNAAEGLSDSSDEWIEIHNTLGHLVRVGGCKLRDLRGSIKTYTIPNGKTISAGGYLAFYSKETPISMNNDEDGIALLSSSGATVFQTAIYKDSEGGNSFAYDGESWVWTSTPTPKADNVLTKLTDKDKKKSKKKNKKSKKDKVKNSQVATNSPGDGEVLGAKSDHSEPKANDKFLGYFMIALSFAFIAGYALWIKKDFINENIIQKFRRDS